MGNFVVLNRAEGVKICIVIPVYNEEETIENNIKAILSYAAKLPVRVNVLAVDDGSTDKTHQILARISALYSSDEFESVSHKQNKGYGAAQRTGIRFAVDSKFDYIIFMDSDLTDHPQYLMDFYTKITQGYEYIKTTRFVKGGIYKIGRAHV